MMESRNFTEDRDEHLIAATLRGDTSSFGPIVERYWNMAFALALSRIDDAVEAEDIAQESFIKAHLQLHTLRDQSCFAGWLSGIITQQCTNVLRKKAREKSILSSEPAALEALSSSSATMSNPGLSPEEARVVRRQVRRLPEKLRTAIIMRFVAGLSARQIARQLGKRHSTIRVRLHRAYQILRKELGPLLEEAEP